MKNGKYLGVDNYTNHPGFIHLVGNAGEGCTECTADTFEDYDITNGDDKSYDVFDLIWYYICIGFNGLVDGLTWFGQNALTLANSISNVLIRVSRNIGRPISRTFIFVMIALMARQIYPAIGEELAPLYELIDQILLPALGWLCNIAKTACVELFAEGGYLHGVVVAIHSILGI